MLWERRGEYRMMKTTEELAREHGRRVRFTANNGCYEFWLEHLEASRKACIADYFESAEPSWYMYKEDEGGFAFLGSEFGGDDEAIPLYTKPKETE